MARNERRSSLFANRQIRDALIDSPSGPRVPLGSLAEIREVREPNVSL
jgi:hypothetical protein